MSKLLLAFAVAAVSAFPLHAASPLTEVRFAPDIAVVLGTGNTIVDPGAVGSDNLATAPGTVTGIALGALPAGAKVLAYHKTAGGNALFVLDTAAALGAVLATPRTVIQYNGSAYSVFFDAASHGVPEGTMIDALALVDDTDLLVSFDVPVNLPGSVYADPRDLVRYNVGAGTWSKYFDGVAAGVAAGLNLQDVHAFDHNRHLLMTFDGSGTLGGINFGPDSVLEYAAPSTWTLVYDGSQRDARWNGNGGEADLVALYAETLHNVLDVDGNTVFDPLTDGLLVLRYLFGLSGDALIANAVGINPVPTRPDAATIAPYLALIAPFLDADGNGTLDALTDGLLIVRYLDGLRGTALTAGVLGAAPAPTRTGSQIETYINRLTQ